MKCFCALRQFVCLIILFSAFASLKGYAQPTCLGGFNSGNGSFIPTWTLRSYDGNIFFVHRYEDVGGIHFKIMFAGAQDNTPQMLTTGEYFSYPPGPCFRIANSNNNLAFFTTSIGNLGSELYTTDGTPSGTQLVIDLTPPNGNSVYSTVSFSGYKTDFVTSYENKLVYLNLNGDVFTSDGTAAGTIKLFTPVNPPYGFIELNGKLMFMADNPSHTGMDIYCYENGAVTKLTASYLHALSASSALLGRIGNNVYYHVSDGTGSPYISYVVKTNGVSAAIIDTLNGCKDMVIYDNAFIYSRNSFSPPCRLLCRADSNMQNEVLLKQSGFGAYWTQGTASTSQGVYFWGDPDDGSSYGEELWRTDGTVPGTYMVKDINPGISPGMPGGPRQMFEFCGKFYFTANNIDHGEELWVTDGTTGGTHIFHEFIPGIEPSVIAEVSGSDGKLYVYANDSLWRFDICQPSAISAVPAAQKIKFWPNPVRNELHVKGLPKPILDAKAIDMYGLSYKLSVRNDEIDVSNLSAGYYIVRLTDLQGNLYSDKILVDR